MSFDAAYDRLVTRWGRPVEHLDLAGTHVNACGPAHAPPLVLLAGHGATAASWYAVAAELSGCRRIYAPDLPGDAGRSTARPPRTVDDVVDWLARVIAGLGLQRPELAGHSYGAWIGLTYAVRRETSRVTLLDPTDCFAGLRPSYVGRALPLLLRPSVRRSDAFLRWETQGLPLDPEWLQLAGLAAVEPGTRPVRPRRPDLTGLATDLQVVVADRSLAHNATTVAARAAAHGATVVRLGRATHHSLPTLHSQEVAPLLSGEG